MDLFTAIASDQNVAPAFRRIFADAMPFRARCGKQPSFSTSAQQVAYERGYQEFPTQPWGGASPAALQGYIDAEQAHTDELIARAERRTSDFACLDDGIESVICGDCNGSGEGMHDGSSCRTCGGEGEVLE